MAGDIDPFLRIATHGEEQFLLDEGLDVLASYRAIKSPAARAAVIKIIVAIVEAQQSAQDEALDLSNSRK